MTHLTPLCRARRIGWLLAILLCLASNTPGIAATPECPLYTIQPGQTLEWPLRSTTTPSAIPGIHSHFPHHISGCFILHNTSSSVLQLLVHLENPRLNHAELNSVSNGITSSAQFGMNYPLPLWSTTGTDAIFTVNLQPGAQSTHELLIGSMTRYNSMIHITERTPLLQSLAQNKSIAGALTGMIGILTLYFLFLSISTREKTFFYLAGSTASVTLMQLSDLGLLYPLWPLSTHWNQTCSGFFAVLSTLFGNCLARHYLNTRTAMPRTDKILNAFGWYMFLITLPLSLTNQQALMVPLFAIPALIFMLLLLAVSIARISQGFLPARLYLIAYLLPLVSGISIVLITVGIVPSSPLSHLLPITGTAAQLILFSLALGERINWLNTERNTAHLATLRARTETQTKRHFLAQISHELRTPLVGIIGLTELIQRQHYNESDIHIIDGMESSAKQLLRMTNTLLDHARLDAGKWSPKATVFSINQVLQDAVGENEAKAMAKKLTINVHIHDNVPTTVTGDPDILRRILHELLDNAIKFTPRGGIVIMVENPQRHSGASSNQFDNHSQSNSAFIRFEVIDTGIGFDHSFHSRIFKLFELADGSSTRIQQGSGLGLSLCKKLCELAGGAIDCESHPNEGTIFWFTLPMGVTGSTSVDEPIPAYLALAGTKQALQNGKRLLIAEDDAAIQMIVCSLLKNLGYHNQSLFDNGLKLLDDYRQYYADTALVLLDWNMPLMNGQQTLQAIRAFEKEHNLPPVAVVIMSAHDAHSHLAETLGSTTPILYKPVTSDALKQLLDIV